MLFPSAKFERLIELEPISLDSSVIIEGDSLRALHSLPSNSVQSIITSPPYWGLRDYDVPGQIGLESSLPQFINRLIAVFGEARRVLRDDGVLWLNIGDGYTSGNRGYRAADKKNPARAMSIRPNTPDGLKSKDLQGIPWRLAFALQDDGWFLRSEVIWHKPNAAPESVKDRPTRAHEHLFMLTKSERYYYDYEASQELGLGGRRRNIRSVWSINTQPFPSAHFATFPPALVEPCLLTTSRPGDFVLDPFFGSGTVGLVSARYGRKYVGIELNPDYVRIATDRLFANDQKLIRLAA
jgi:site-specific DNA-methyltransferase (cytosine-N4-specific)